MICTSSANCIRNIMRKSCTQEIQRSLFQARARDVTVDSHSPLYITPRSCHDMSLWSKLCHKHAIRFTIYHFLQAESFLCQKHTCWPDDRQVLTHDARMKMEYVTKTLWSFFLQHCLELFLNSSLILLKISKFLYHLQVLWSVKPRSSSQLLDKTTWQ